MTAFPIPDAALGQHTIALGKTRSGKSSALRLIAERMLDAGKPLGVIDPKGDWWGLRSNARGTGAGYPVVIFGGEHADVPINQHAGAHVAELVATGNRPFIIDLGGWMVGERTRFFIAFASALFRHMRGPRWLIVDECHNFAPQGKILDPDAGKMLHWANRLASEGAGKGLTLLSASQRPQKVHKDYLTCHETLIAMRVVHPLDRRAVKDWVDGCDDPLAGGNVIGSLASMRRGEAWVWSPEAEFGPVRVQFPMFKTYDSFKAPEGEPAGPLKGWASVDLDDVRTKLGTIVEEAKANDPRLLKARIAELERQVKQAPAAAAAPSPAPAIDEAAIFAAGRAEGVRIGCDIGARKVREQDQLLLKPPLEALVLAVDGLRSAPMPDWDEQLKAMVFDAPARRRGGSTQSGHGAFERASSRFEQASRRAAAGDGAAAKRLPALGSKVSASAQSRFTSGVKAENRNHQPPPSTTHVAGAGDGERLLGAQQKILDALAELAALGIKSAVRIQVAFLAGYSHLASKGFANGLGALHTAGFIEYPSKGYVALTPAGEAQADFREVLSVPELQRRVMDLLGPRFEKILKPLIAAYPGSISREELMRAAGYGHLASKGFANSIGRLRSLGFIDSPASGQLAARPVLFLEER